MNDTSYKLGDMIKAFPAYEFGKMVSNIDRFETYVSPERKAELNAIEKSEQVSEQIIEEM